MIKTYTIEIDPISWKRPGTRVLCRKPRFYDKQALEKETYANYLQLQHGKDPLFSGPIEMIITFYMPLPRGNRTKTKYYHYSAPDIDNLQKFLYDACSNVVFTDDRIICKLSVIKLYSREPRTEFTIKDLE